MVGGKGRKKIEIRKIEDVARRRVTFSKRKKGLFRKVEELGILTGCKVAAIVFTDAGKRAYTAGDLSVLTLYENNESSSYVSCVSAEYDHFARGGGDNHLSNTSVGLPEIEECGLGLDDLEWMDDVEDSGNGVPSAENNDDFWETLEIPQLAETMGSSGETNDPNRGASYHDVNNSFFLPEVIHGLGLQELLDLKKKLEELKFQVLQKQLSTGDGDGDFFFSDFNL